MFDRDSMSSAALRLCVMAPAVFCFPAYNASSNATIDQLTGTSGDEDPPAASEFQALLYIVITLLFYSVGISIGIVTYLKKEKQEIEENKMFEEFISFDKDNHNLEHRFARVQLVIERLKEIEEIKLLSTTTQGGNIYNEALSDSVSTGENSLSLGAMEGESFDVAKCEGDAERGENEPLEDDPFPDRRLSQVVAKILEGDCITEDEDSGEGDTTRCDSMQWTKPPSYEDYQYLVEYNQEPKNKELSRDSKEFGKLEAGQMSFDDSVSHTEETDTLVNVDSTKPEEGEFDEDRVVVLESSQENPSQPWSVTSV